MNILHALILAITQGITEFLPISSSGHLILLRSLLKNNSTSIGFDVMLHIGTTVAIIIYFYKDIFAIIKGIYFNVMKKELLTNEHLENAKLGYMIIIATIPAAICGLLFEDLIENIFRNPLSVSFFLIIVAILLLIVEKKSLKTRNIFDLTYKTALFIGLFQSLALMPGVSRSGITIIAGLICGLKRNASAKFSFLLSTPVILGAGVLKLKDVIGKPVDSDIALNYIIGFIVSVVVGYAAISFLLNFVKKHNLNIFVWYRVVLGISIIIYTYSIGL